MADNSKPAHTIRLGRVLGRVWKNRGPDGDWYSVTVVREYAVGDEPKTAHSFGRDDLLVVGEVARLCYYWIADALGQGAVTKGVRRADDVG